MSGTVVVLGGDGLIGRSLVEALEQRGAGDELRLVGTDAELASLELGSGELRAQTPDLTEALADARAAVVCAPPSEEQRPRLESAAKEMPVLDLCGAFDADPLDARRCEELKPGLWCSPSASALLASALVRAAAAAGATATAQVLALESLSELGSEALDEMHGQAVALLNFSELPTARLGAQVVHDLHSPGIDGAERERRLRRELAVLCDGPVSCLRVQAGVFHGAGVAVRCQLPASDWSAAVAEEPRLALAQAGVGASPVAAVQAGRVLIGRIDDDGAGGAWAWAAADGLDQGAVGNAAELLALLP